MKLQICSRVIHAKQLRRCSGVANNRRAAASPFDLVRPRYPNLRSQLVRIVWLCILSASLSLAHAATTATPDKRDGQVLDALLLHLLADPGFEMMRVPANGATIVLHARTPEKTGFLQSSQMRHDIGNHSLPSDAQRDLQRRNSLPDAKQDTYDAVAASFTNLTFGAGIVVADLTNLMNQRRASSVFGTTYPKARGWVQAYLPGYSKDATCAIVRAGIGPSSHGAMVTALLERNGEKWLVKWHHIARYV